MKKKSLRKFVQHYKSDWEKETPVDASPCRLFSQARNPLKLLSRRIKVYLRNEFISLGKKLYSNYLVRTDPQARKITTMFTSQTQSSIPDTSTEEEYETVQRDPVKIQLASIRELKKEVMHVAHNGIPLRSTLTIELTELFANHTFVGIVDAWRRLAAVQHGVKLYLVDYGAIRYPTYILIQSQL